MKGVDPRSASGGVSLAATRNIVGRLGHIGRQVQDVGCAVADSVLDRATHPTIEGQDGFLSFAPDSGAVVNRYQIGAALHRQSDDHPELGSLETLLEHPYPGQRVTFQVGNQIATPIGQTNAKGVQRCPTSLLPDSLQKLNPRTGGLVKVDVSTPQAGHSSASLLALPASYDGPIFICDIDDTLRSLHVTDLIKGVTAPPIPGSSELLESLAGKGVPIIYLSAGSVRLHSDNKAFLQQLPEGILLDREQTGRHFLSPRNSAQARVQGEYKARVIESLRQAYPQARLFGIGDDKYGDAQAYTQTGVQAYIHDVDPTHRNVPANFSGVLTDGYTPEFQAVVEASVQRAIDGSSSFGGRSTAQAVAAP